MDSKRFFIPVGGFLVLSQVDITEGSLADQDTYHINLTLHQVFWLIGVLETAPYDCHIIDYWTEQFYCIFHG